MGAVTSTVPRPISDGRWPSRSASPRNGAPMAPALVNLGQLAEARGHLSAARELLRDRSRDSGERCRARAHARRGARSPRRRGARPERRRQGQADAGSRAGARGTARPGQHPPCGGAAASWTARTAAGRPRRRRHGLRSRGRGARVAGHPSWRLRRRHARPLPATATSSTSTTSTRSWPAARPTMRLRRSNARGPAACSCCSPNATSSSTRTCRRRSASRASISTNSTTARRRRSPSSIRRKTGRRSTACSSCCATCANAAPASSTRFAPPRPVWPRCSRRSRSTWRGVHQALDPGTVLLSYQVGKDSSRLFVVQRKGAPHGLRSTCTRSPWAPAACAKR